MADQNEVKLEKVDKAPGTACPVSVDHPEGCNMSGTDYKEWMDRSQEFLVTQTTKGWFQECCGCDANSQFKFVINGEHVGMIDERSSCCNRFCCGNNRWWYTRMVAGTNKDSEENDKLPALLNFYRPYRCVKGPCKCCCYQEVLTMDGAGNFLGGVKEQFWCCVPKFTVMNEKQEAVYDIHQPTCCGGQCVNCCAEGCCNCRIPFYMYPPGGDDESMLNASGATKAEDAKGEVARAQICKIWYKNDFLKGLATELFTDADKFEMKAPDGADHQMKAVLVGTTLMINQVFFERGDDDNLE